MNTPGTSRRVSRAVHANNPGSRCAGSYPLARFIRSAPVGVPSRVSLSSAFPMRGWRRHLSRACPARGASRRAPASPAPTFAVWEKSLRIRKYAEGRANPLRKEARARRVNPVAADSATGFDSPRPEAHQRPSPMQALFSCLHPMGAAYQASRRAVCGSRKARRSSGRSVNRASSATCLTAGWRSLDYQRTAS